jgi:hypothetical protein
VLALALTACIFFTCATCCFTWTDIAEQIGARHHRSRVSRVGRELIQSGRLFVDQKGHIGIQKDYDRWVQGPGPVLSEGGPEVARARSGPSAGPEVAREPGQFRTSIRERARAVLTVESYPVIEGPPPVTPRPNDTPTARAIMGDPAKPPQDHPDFLRLSFKLQDRLADDWLARVKARNSGPKAKCWMCSTRGAVLGAALCAECAWCWKCDDAGRPSKGKPAEMVIPRDGGRPICRECASKERT